MTQEQFKKAVHINDRLEALKKTKEKIAKTSEHRLYFAYKSSDEFRCCPDWSMRPIADLLDKHDRMIREEIDEEIERLTKEIETL